MICQYCDQKQPESQSRFHRFCFVTFSHNLAGARGKREPISRELLKQWLLLLTVAAQTTAQECGRGVSRDYDRNSSEATQALLLYRTICKLSRTFSSLTPFSFNFARQPTVLYATYVCFERIRMGLIYYFDSCLMAWDRSQNVLPPILIFLKVLKTRKI